jgi:hypothetical protein
MKKFADQLYIYGIITIILFSLNRIADMFDGWDTIRNIGGGSLFVGIIKIPFCIWGIVQICRGLCSVLGSDFEMIHTKFDTDKNRGVVIIINVVATIVGCLLAFAVL